MLIVDAGLSKVQGIFFNNLGHAIMLDMKETVEDGDYYILANHFEKPPPKIPYKAILLATALFTVGSVLIIIGALLLAGYIDVKYSDRTWPLLIIGSLMFIPGAYHVRLAYCAWRGYRGYSYEDIPDFDD